MQISNVSSIVPKINNTAAGVSSGESSFTNILTDAINNAKDTESSAQQQNVSLLTGDTDDLHTPMIEAQKAELALSLAIQVRNKVVEAYNEVMRMQL